MFDLVLSHPSVVMFEGGCYRPIHLLCIEKGEIQTRTIKTRTVKDGYGDGDGEWDRGLKLIEHALTEREREQEKIPLANRSSTICDSLSMSRNYYGWRSIWYIIGFSKVRCKQKTLLWNSTKNSGLGIGWRCYLDHTTRVTWLNMRICRNRTLISCKKPLIHRYHFRWVFVC